MSDLPDRLARVRERMERAARAVGRDPASVRLVAVSKTFPAERVIDAVAAGVRCFGENRVQEASAKIPQVQAQLSAQTRGHTPGAQVAPSCLEWHLVGRLQRNKARRAVELFDVIHSVDRAPLAEALARAAETLRRQTRVLIQVNLDAEPQKGGVEPERAAALLRAIDGHPALTPVGLMAIPGTRGDPEEVRPAFAHLRELRDALNRGRDPTRRLQELSMGMSADFEVAIQEGATWIRVGTALFGERTTR